jgi:signal transduction histidine kinase
MPSGQDTSFARLVSLACHDLRTPLATVHGFARTISRRDALGEPESRYVAMIEAASDQLAELLEQLSLAARIEDGRYEPALRDGDSLELTTAAAAGLEPGLFSVEGTGGEVAVDVPAVERALRALARCALRHGGLEHVDIRVDGLDVSISPITPASAPVVLGEDLRDLGAAVAVRALRASGGSVELEGETLRVRLPTVGAGRAGGP